MVLIVEDTEEAFFEIEKLAGFNPDLDINWSISNLTGRNTN